MQDGARGVRDFYNGFTADRMVGYRLRGNERIEAAIAFISSRVRRGATVVDIGCGIGIATEAAARRAAPGRVIGVDIAEQNVRYASRTVGLGNVTFHCLDVTRERDRLAELTGGAKVDVFVMVDVIEHLPEDTRRDVFRTMAELGSEEMVVLLTYPSPRYQRHVMAHDPGELQVIDNVIELSDLTREAGQHGLEVSSFELKDVWRPGQYVHCTLRRASELDAEIGREIESGGRRARLRRILNRVLLPLRKRRYAITESRP